MNLRIGVIFPSKDPLGPDQWSGTPFGLARGFESLGAEVVPIGHFFPPGIRQAEAALARVAGQRGAVADRTWTRVRSRRWTFQRQLRRAGELNLVVAMVTEAYHLQDLETDCPIATYSDSTFQQMSAHPESDVSNAGFPRRVVGRWIATERDSLRRADAVCVGTHWAKRSMVQDYGIAQSKVHVVGMGHRPRIVRPNIRDWTTPVYLFVGVDWRRKNGRRVVDAFARLRDDIPSARLHLVGRHPPIDAPNVVDHGLLKQNDPLAQQTLDALFAESTAFVLPSLFDPYGIAYLEAASAGLPVIATREGGAGEVLGPAAIAVDPLDDEAILGGMRELANPQTAQRMGAVAARAAAKSTWIDAARRILRATGIRTEDHMPAWSTRQ